MQQRDVEDIIRNLSQQSDNQNMQQAAGRLRAAMQTTEGMQAVQQIMQKYGGTLETAARMAQAGNINGAKQSVQALMNTPEGALLAAQIAGMMGR